MKHSATHPLRLLELFIINTAFSQENSTIEQEKETLQQIFACSSESVFVDYCFFQLNTAKYRKPSFLFMIFAFCVNGVRAVNLLQKHDTRQLVRKGHFAHRQAQLRFLLHFL